MNIEYKTGWMGRTLVISGEAVIDGISQNVTISEDAEERTWEGTKCVNRDVSTDALETLSFALGEMICDRKANFDSSELIKELFDKLPPEVAYQLSIDLFKEYGQTQEK
jgi:hypothetical protein